MITEVVITAVDINENESTYSDSVSTFGLSVTFTLPEEFELYSCYPNPFNPVTTISYSIPKSDDVEISVYNIDGTLENQLFNGYQTVGNYNFNWNAELKSSGIYIVKVRLGDRIKTQKVLLLK